MAHPFQRRPKRLELLTQARPTRNQFAVLGKTLAIGRLAVRR